MKGRDRSRAPSEVNHYGSQRPDCSGNYRNVKPRLTNWIGWGLKRESAQKCLSSENVSVAICNIC
jgi:hypothetical protein